jgi:hypothetical protein
MSDNLWQDLKTKVDKTSDELVEARIELKAQGVQIQQIKENVGGLHTKVDRLIDHTLQSANKSSAWWRSLAFKVLLALVGAGGLGVGAKVLLGESQPVQAKTTTSMEVKK